MLVLKNYVMISYVYFSNMNMWDFELEFQKSDFYKDLKVIESSSRWILYSSWEISREQKNNLDFQESILEDYLSTELLAIAENIRSIEEKSDFLKLINQYKGKLNTRYLYNVRGRTLLKKLEEVWLSDWWFEEFLRITQDTWRELWDLATALWNKFKYYSEKSFEETADVFRNIEWIFDKFQVADREERLWIVLKLSASWLYEALEPTKKVKILSIFLPNALFNLIMKSTSKFNVNWRELNTWEIIDNFIWLIEDWEWILAFLEIDTKKIFNYDIWLIS